MTRQTVSTNSSIKEFEYNYAPPKHILRSVDGSPTDVFEFVCAPEWHQQFIIHSFDHGSGRPEPEGLVQFAAIGSLVSGLWSWINPKYVLVWCDSFGLRTPVYTGDKIKIFFRTGNKSTSPRTVEIEVQVLKEGRWIRVARTKIQIVRSVMT